jgi:hypothetical protein
MLTILLFVLSIMPVAPYPASGGSTLCCHTHPDGFVGCWPSTNGECKPGEKVLPCRGGSHQTNLNDEESWQCDTYPNA